MKVHLIETDIPLPAKVVTVIPKCGRPIGPVQVVYMRDGEVIDKALTLTSAFCRKCFDVPLEGKRYLYGVANAEEMMHQD